MFVWVLCGVAVISILIYTNVKTNSFDICKFNFAAPAFASARQLLLEDSRQDFDWVIVDEIGKLELKGEGLEPAAAEVIEYYKTGRAKGRLLLVVRDELVEQAVKHYGLVEYRIIRLEEAMPH